MSKDKKIVIIETLTLLPIILVGLYLTNTQYKLGGPGTVGSTTPSSVNVAYDKLLKDTRLNNIVDNAVAKIQQYQSEYILTHDVYWQGISSKHPTLKPPTVDSDWTALNIPGLQDVPIDVRVDEYQTPTEKGFTVVIRAEVEGRTFTKIISTDGRNIDWTYYE